MSDLAPLLDEGEVSALLRVAVPTLRNWRAKQRGPVFVKLGLRSVRYRKSDVDAFVAAGQRGAQDGAE